jgi:uncharacterized membrane protein
MASLLAAATFFVAIHFLISGSALRARIVEAIGEGPFRGVFSLLSLVGIIWLSRAYGQADYIQLWGKLYALRPIALVMMLPAFFFVVLAFTSPNPTAVGGGALLSEKEPAKGIQRITRHPFLWGVTLWALTHLILNGDVASLVFFGSLLIVAVGGPFSIDRKRKKAFWGCLESIRRPNLERTLYGNHRRAQRAANQGAGIVACGFVVDSLRLVSSLSPDSVRRLAMAGLRTKQHHGEARGSVQFGLESNRMAVCFRS